MAASTRDSIRLLMGTPDVNADEIKRKQEAKAEAAYKRGVELEALATAAEKLGDRARAIDLIRDAYATVNAGVSVKLSSEPRYQDFLSNTQKKLGQLLDPDGNCNRPAKSSSASIEKVQTTLLHKEISKKQPNLSDLAKSDLEGMSVEELKAKQQRILGEVAEALQAFQKDFSLYTDEQNTDEQTSQKDMVANTLAMSNCLRHLKSLLSSATITSLASLSIAKHPTLR
jgi:hypothetical protein